MKLHEAYRGRKLGDVADAAPGGFKCALCDRVFATARVAGMHERMRHKKWLRKLRAGR